MLELLEKYTKECTKTGILGEISLLGKYIYRVFNILFIIITIALFVLFISIINFTDLIKIDLSIFLDINTLNKNIPMIYFIGLLFLICLFIGGSVSLIIMNAINYKLIAGLAKNSNRKWMFENPYNPKRTNEAFNKIISTNNKEFLEGTDFSNIEFIKNLIELSEVEIRERDDSAEKIRKNGIWHLVIATSFGAYISLFIYFLGFITIQTMDELLSVIKICSLLIFEAGILFYLILRLSDWFNDKLFTLHYNNKIKQAKAFRRFLCEHLLFLLKKSSS